MTPSRKRFYPGSEVGELLCNSLNMHHSKRVMTLLSDLQEAMHATVWLGKVPKPGDVGGVIVVDEATPGGFHVIKRRISESEAKRRAKHSPRQRKERWERVGRTLRAYSFVPELDNWISLPVRAGQLGRRVSFQWRSRNGREGMAVLWILELLKIGRLGRVRRCENCSKWFFSAVKEEGKFCTIRCQRTTYKSKDETREQHREYMRTWRDRKRR